MNLAGKTYKIDEQHIRITILYKIINKLANAPNKEILMPAYTRARSE